jgi:hypothetical protein
MPRRLTKRRWIHCRQAQPFRRTFNQRSMLLEAKSNQIALA